MCSTVRDSICRALRDGSYMTATQRFTSKLVIAHAATVTRNLETTAVDCAKTRPGCQNSSEFTLKH